MKKPYIVIIILVVLAVIGVGAVALTTISAKTTKIIITIYGFFIYSSSF